MICVPHPPTSSQTFLCAFVREIGLMEAEAERQRQAIESLGEEREAATAALAQEVERLRGLIKRFAGPAPSPSVLQAVHLEAFKNGPNPVVLKTVRSAPSLHLPLPQRGGPLEHEAPRSSKPSGDARGRAGHQARSAPRPVPAWRGLRGTRVAPS